MSTELSFEKAQMSTNDSGVWLSLKLPFESRQKARDFVLNIKPDKKYKAELKEKNDHRSLDQNGYYWVLCGKLSAVLNIPPEDIYREHIKDVGGNFAVTPIKAEAVSTWIRVWNGKGTGFVAEDIGESKIAGYRNIRNYYGSSTYDKAQMSRLLNLIIADCKENGIETMTPEELARLEA